MLDTNFTVYSIAVNLCQTKSDSCITIIFLCSKFSGFILQLLLLHGNLEPDEAHLMLEILLCVYPFWEVFFYKSEPNETIFDITTKFTTFEF